MPNILGRLRAKARGWNEQFGPRSLRIRRRVGEKVNAFIRSPFESEFLLKQRVIHLAPLAIIPYRAGTQAYRHFTSVWDLLIRFVLRDGIGHSLLPTQDAQTGQNGGAIGWGRDHTQYDRLVGVGHSGTSLLCWIHYTTFLCKKQENFSDGYCGC